MCGDLSEYERYLNQIWYNARYSSTRRSNARMFRFYLPQKSMTAVTAILNFRKCQYFQILWRYVHQIWWEDASQPYRVDRPSDQKSKLKVNSDDVIRWTSGTNVFIKCNVFIVQVSCCRFTVYDWQHVQRKKIKRQRPQWSRNMPMDYIRLFSHSWGRPVKP